MREALSQITPEIIAVCIGYAIRHFVVPLTSGREISSLIRYLQKNE